MLGLLARMAVSWAWFMWWGLICFGIAGLFVLIWVWFILGLVDTFVGLLLWLCLLNVSLLLICGVGLRLL